MISDRFLDATGIYTEFRRRESELGDVPIVEGAITSLTSSTLSLTPGGGGAYNVDLPQSLNTNSDVQFQSIKLNSTAQVKGIRRGTVNIDPPSIAATSRGTATGTMTGLTAGDFVQLMPPAALEAGLLFGGAYISGADTVTVMLYNPTGAPVDGVALDWEYLWFDLT